MGPTIGGPRARRHRGDLLRNPRFEIMPVAGALDQIEELPRGAVVTVTASPRQGAAVTIDLAERLADQGVQPVPHLAARQLHDEHELSHILRRLDTAGIGNVFVVGGDATTPAGKFGDGLSLLEAMESIGHGLTDIGIPSYPDGHHAIDEQTLMAALRAKQSYASYTVTQMCFDASAISRFSHSARRHGITLPIYAGIPGIVDTAKLLRVSLRIGVGDSVRFLKGNRSVATKLLRPRGYRPDGLVRKLGTAVSDGSADLQGLHIYTFNHLAPTVRWTHNAHRRLAS